MSDLYWYGKLRPIPFKITKDGAGINPTLVLGDVTLASFDEATPSVITVTDIPLSEITVVDATDMLGWHVWTPTGTKTQAEQLVINVKDVGGTAFDENGIVVTMGGHANAFLDGG